MPLVRVKRGGETYVMKLPYNKEGLAKAAKIKSASKTKKGTKRRRVNYG